MTKREIANQLYDTIENAARSDGVEAYNAIRLKLAQNDRFYLLTRILGRQDLQHEWLFDRCREAEAQVEETKAYFWPRDHRKSSILTLGGITQNVLIDANSTNCILSYNRREAKKFLRWIKNAFEETTALLEIAPHIFFKNPLKEAIKWTEEDGLSVKRTENRREQTVEAYGMVESLPTGSHPTRVVLDDIIVADSVLTPGAIQKVTDAWEKAIFIADSSQIKRVIVGTRYHHADTYGVMIERGMPVSIHKATDNGELDGEPVFLTRQQLKNMYTQMGRYNFYSQMMMMPTPEKNMSFNVDWINYYQTDFFPVHNTYIVVDPASGQGKGHDFSVYAVISIGSDGNYYLRDLVRDKYTLTDRARVLFELVEKYAPIAVGYEKYGMQADIEYIKELQSQYNFYFTILPLGGQVKKEDRIRRLVPIFQFGKFLLPQRIVQATKNNFGEEVEVDNIKELLIEYTEFPFSKHDDILDCLSRICDESMMAFKPMLGQKGLPSKVMNSYLSKYNPLGALNEK